MPTRQTARSAAAPDSAPPARLAPLLALAAITGEETPLDAAALAAGLPALLVQEARAAGRLRVGPDGRLLVDSPADAERALVELGAAVRH